MRASIPLILCLASAGQAFGWGCQGHEMIALIARAHLSPVASSAVDKLLGRNPIDPNLDRYCKDRPADLMADAATWADDTRKADRTGHWHFIDIPLTAARGAGRDQWCPPVGPPVEGEDRSGCVLSAIEYEWAILRDRKRGPRERARALRYIIHFVGDMHQPLHDSD